MHKITFSILLFGLISSALILVSGTLGYLHPLGDSLSIFKIPALAAIGIFSALLMARARFWGLFTLIAVAALSAHYLSRLDFNEERASDFTLYQKNLSYRLQSADDLIADIMVTEADYVTFQEVTEENLRKLAPLSERYSHVHFCPFHRVGGVAVFSRIAPVEGSQRCYDGNGAASLQVETDRGPVWVTSVHIHWPYPYRQMEQVKDLVPQLRTLDGAHVVGGDFNMVPWGHSISQFRSMGLRRLSQTRTTFKIEDFVPISIDHVLGTFDRVSTETRPLLGSDHYGLLVRFR